jgi:twitching motility two-component system response regulator PilH
MARILVVEDSPVETHQMVNLLVRHGHQVITAASGDEGLAMAKDQIPDAILMDVVLPGINGFQATRQITRGDETRHIPVIMVSAKRQEADRVWGERQGAVAYLVKPVKDDELMNCLNTALQAGSSPGAAG